MIAAFGPRVTLSGQDLRAVAYSSKKEWYADFRCFLVFAAKISVEISVYQRAISLLQALVWRNKY
jgi:hypothetical protein